MSVQGLATNLLLPPLLLVVVALAAAVLLRRRGLARGIVTASMVAILLLATPFAAGTLRTLIERDAAARAIPAGPAPAAIVILGGEAASRSDGRLDPGPLTLERIAAGARLARRTGLPILVTGGPLSPNGSPIAEVMAETLASSFGLGARWIEPSARDTAGNAALSAALLARENIAAAYVVTHAWHMPRALDAFARTGLVAIPEPVRLSRAPDGQLSDWAPRPDHLAESWFMLREWLGRIIYRLRDG